VLYAEKNVDTETLRHTRDRSLFDLKNLQYDPDKEIVTAYFDNGWTKVVNVSADSGIAMIKDIIRHIV